MQCTYPSICCDDWICSVQAEVDIRYQVQDQMKAFSRNCAHPFLMDQQPSKLLGELHPLSEDLQLQTIISMEPHEPAMRN